MTFSIVARDAGTSGSGGERWGVAVASKFLAVGSAVPGVRPPLGAIATQSFANLRYVPDGFAHLAAGLDAQATLDALTAADDLRGQRQAGVVDGVGRAATFTGDDCLPWAGGITGDGYAIQGNILTGPEVVEAMEAAYLATTGPLERRLLAALLAGDRAGGDSRGRQSAALLVGGIGAGYGGTSDIAIDLRVDDHPDPCPELERLLGIHEMLFGKPEDVRPLTGDIAARLSAALTALGYPTDDLVASLHKIAGIENLEERLVDDGIDIVVLEHLEGLAAK